MIKGVFFDLDGTLIKSMHHHYKGWKNVLSKNNIHLDKQYFYLYEGIKLENLIRNLYIKHKKKFNNKILQKLINEKDNHFKLNAKIYFYNGVKSLIKYLHQENIYLAMVTAGTKKRVFKTLPLKFINYFDKIITGSDCKYGKPHPEPYLKALSFSKLKKNNCLVVENAPLGIKSAKSAGLKTIAITNTLESTSLQSSDFIVSSMNELKQIYECL